MNYHQLTMGSGGVAVSKNWSRVKDSSEKSLLFLDLWRSSAVSKKENPLIYGDCRLVVGERRRSR